MTTTKPIVQDQVNVISLKSAKSWHKAFKDQNKNMGFAKGDFPNSIVIPFADIEQIVTDFRDSVHETVNGVRIYFIIKPATPEIKEKERLNISCICVPTKGPYLKKSDIDANKRFTDMVIEATLRDGAPRNADRRGDTEDTELTATVAAVSEDSDDDYVSVYDVTQPCPPFCDPESPIS